jgi:hypothetical protein
MTGEESDLSLAGTYTANPNYLYPSTQTVDLSLKARISHRTASSGDFVVTVTYV